MKGGWERGSLVGQLPRQASHVRGGLVAISFVQRARSATKYVQHSQNPSRYLCHNGSDVSQDENPWLPGVPGWVAGPKKLVTVLRK